MRQNSHMRDLSQSYAPARNDLELFRRVAGQQAPCEGAVRLREDDQSSAVHSYDGASTWLDRWAVLDVQQGLLHVYAPGGQGFGSMRGALLESIPIQTVRAVSVRGVIEQASSSSVPAGSGKLYSDSSHAVVPSPPPQTSYNKGPFEFTLRFLASIPAPPSPEAPSRPDGVSGPGSDGLTAADGSTGSSNMPPFLTPGLASFSSYPGGGGSPASTITVLRSVVFRLASRDRLVEWLWALRKAILLHISLSLKASASSTASSSSTGSGDKDSSRGDSRGAGGPYSGAFAPALAGIPASGTPTTSSIGASSQAGYGYGYGHPGTSTGGSSSPASSVTGPLSALPGAMGDLGVGSMGIGAALRQPSFATAVSTSDELDLASSLQPHHHHQRVSSSVSGASGGGIGGLLRHNSNLSTFSSAASVASSDLSSTVGPLPSQPHGAQTFTPPQLSQGSTPLTGDQPPAAQGGIGVALRSPFSSPRDAHEGAPFAAPDSLHQAMAAAAGVAATSKAGTPTPGSGNAGAAGGQYYGFGSVAGFPAGIGAAPAGGGIGAALSRSSTIPNAPGATSGGIGSALMSSSLPATSGMMMMASSMPANYHNRAAGGMGLGGGMARQKTFFAQPGSDPMAPQAQGDHSSPADANLPSTQGGSNIPARASNDFGFRSSLGSSSLSRVSASPSSSGPIGIVGGGDAQMQRRSRGGSGSFRGASALGFAGSLLGTGMMTAEVDNEDDDERSDDDDRAEAPRHRGRGHSKSSQGTSSTSRESSMSDDVDAGASEDDDDALFAADEDEKKPSKALRAEKRLDAVRSAELKAEAGNVTPESAVRRPQLAHGSGIDDQAPSGLATNMSSGRPPLAPPPTSASSVASNLSSTLAAPASSPLLPLSPEGTSTTAATATSTAADAAAPAAAPTRSAGAWKPKFIRDREAAAAAGLKPPEHVGVAPPKEDDQPAAGKHHPAGHAHGHGHAHPHSHALFTLGPQPSYHLMNPHQQHPLHPHILEHHRNNKHRVYPKLRRRSRNNSATHLHLQDADGKHDGNVNASEDHGGAAVDHDALIDNLQRLFTQPQPDNSAVPSASQASAPAASQQAAHAPLAPVATRPPAGWIGAWSDRGLRPYMEDAFTWIPALAPVASSHGGATTASSLDAEASSSTPASTSFFAVYDGHAGSNAATFAARYLHQHLARHLLFRSAAAEDLSLALTDAFASVERDLLAAADAGAEQLRQEREKEREAKGQDGKAAGPFLRARPKDLNSGATALAVVVRGRTLLVANLGDCRAVLGRKGGGAVQLTNDHTPLSEQSRIEHAGGWLVSGQEMHVIRVSSRSGGSAGSDKTTGSGLGAAGSASGGVEGGSAPALPSLSQDPFIRHRAEHEPMRTTVLARVCGDLAVSRALGDPDYKGVDRMALVDWDWPEEGHPKTFRSDLILATPEVTRREVEEGDEFLILACDGLWEVLSSEEAAEQAWKLLQAGLTPTAASKRLVEMALYLGSSDNITAMLILLPTTSLPQAGHGVTQ